MKFLIFFLIATLGFSNLSPEALDKNVEYSIEEYIHELQSTVNLIASSDMENEIPNNCEKVSIDSSNPYWEKISVKGNYEININFKNGKHGLVMRFPKNFIVNNSYSFKEEIHGTSILDMEIANIEYYQYLFIQHKPDVPIRIYKDAMDPSLIHIAIAKTINPYPYKVVIDPGHGGFDPGASHFGVHEKDIVLDIALRMEHKLKDLGIDTIYTRSTDEFVILHERAYMSNEINPDAFVSIHINGSTSKTPRGIATFLYTPRGFQRKEREALARAIQSSLTEEFPDWKDWGLLRENFCVIRETKNPSVLVEFGFLSNPIDRAFLVQEEIRERAAKAIVKGINLFVKNNDGY